MVNEFADPLNHPWNVSPAEAKRIQLELRDRVERRSRVGRVRRVAGVDVGFEQGGTVTRAAVVLLSYPRLEYLEHGLCRAATTFPYVPGLLSFRECPATMKALAQLQTQPDVILCDGQGFAHPQRFGLACHLGVLLDVPTVGVAKTRLIGNYQPPAESKGAWTPLRHQGERIGAVLRTRDGVKPLFISVGHRVSLDRAIKLVLGCTTRYRLPETTRWAHRLASEDRLG